MKKQLIFSALLSTALLGSASAWAETADDVDCNGCIRGNEIAKQTITQKNIAKDSIGEKKIKDRAVTADKLSDEVYSALVSAQSLYLVDANGLQVGDYPPLVGGAEDSRDPFSVALFTSDTGVVSVDVDFYFESLKTFELLSAQLSDPFAYSQPYFFTPDCTGTRYFPEKSGERLGVAIGYVADSQLYRMDYQEITYEIKAINGNPESSARSGIQAIEAYVPMYNVNPFSPAGCEASTARFRYDPNTGFVTMYSRSPIYVKDVPTYEGPLRLEMR